MKSVILVLISALLFTPTVSSAGDRSGDEILRNFTKSIAAIYATSKSCENTISPGPKEYISVIGSYFARLYPNGASYWVVPQTAKPITNTGECIRLIETRLSEYKSAYNDYNANYPNVGAVPILVAYQWSDVYTAPEEKKPVKSYLPEAKQRFSK